MCLCIKIFESIRCDTSRLELTKGGSTPSSGYDFRRPRRLLRLLRGRPPLGSCFRKSMTYEGASLLHFGHSGTKPSLMMTKTDKFRQDRTQKTCQAVLLTAISLLPESNEEDDFGGYWQETRLWRKGCSDAGQPRTLAIRR